jgi:hypothetical protein
MGIALFFFYFFQYTANLKVFKAIRQKWSDRNKLYSNNEMAYL